MISSSSSSAAVSSSASMSSLLHVSSLSNSSHAFLFHFSLLIFSLGSISAVYNLSLLPHVIDYFYLFAFSHPNYMFPILNSYHGSKVYVALWASRTVWRTSFQPVLCFIGFSSFTPTFSSMQQYSSYHFVKFYYLSTTKDITSSQTTYPLLSVA